MLLKLPKPRAILFDWDGTLADTWRAIIAAYNLTFITMGMPPWDEKTAKQNIRKSWRDAFPEIFGARADEASQIFRDQYASLNQDYLDCLPGAFELLAALHGAGIYLGVVSNKRGPFLRREVEDFNWNPDGRRVVGAGDCARDKPCAEPIHAALDGSGLLPGPDVWFVGDTGLDLQTAHDTGCTPILVNGVNLKPGEKEEYPPAAEFTDLPALHQGWISVNKA